MRPILILFVMVTEAQKVGDGGTQEHTINVQSPAATIQQGS